MLLLLKSDPNLINGEIFNVGDDKFNFQIGELAEKIAQLVGEYTNKKVKIEWYGDPDHRSYQLDFSKINQTLNWKAKYSLEYGIKEIVDAIIINKAEKSDQTITLEWYKSLEKWHKIISLQNINSDDPEFSKWQDIIAKTKKYGGILDINE
jgi:dTDP-D-glucose 4,6-dehydratase